MSPVWVGDAILGDLAPGPGVLFREEVPEQLLLFLISAIAEEERSNILEVFPYFSGEDKTENYL